MGKSSRSETLRSLYENVLEEARELIDRAHGRSALQAVVSLLHRRIPAYSWVGVYVVQESDLVLAAWDGPEATDHTRIPLGQGICGWAAAHAQSVVVPDVSQDPRYLQCFTRTRSEIVVPVMDEQGVYGEIDVDSDDVDAFAEEDRSLLDKVAGWLAPAVREAQTGG